MEPFYFGTSQQQLFGVYHSADPKAPRRGSVVLCHPTGHEYLRAHRAFRNLATSLAGQGFHVLRFDYFGMGDSAGDGDRTTVDQCVADVSTAIDELKDISGTSKVSLVGLRLGATFATLVAKGRRDIDRILLWDPVLEGARYLEDAIALQQRWLEDRLGARAALEDQGSQLIGFPLTDEIRRGLQATRLDASSIRGLKSVSVFASEDTEPLQQLRRDLLAASVPGDYCVVPEPGEWHNGELVHQILLPHAMIRAVSSALCA